MIAATGEDLRISNGDNERLSIRGLTAIFGRLPNLSRPGLRIILPSLDPGYGLIIIYTNVAACRSTYVTYVRYRSVKDMCKRTNSRPVLVSICSIICT